MLPRQSERERDLLFSSHRKGTDAFGGHSSLYIDSTLLEHDLDDNLFPLFSQSPPRREMAGRSSPINIATQSRNVPASPRHQQVSNLTYALQSTTGNELRPTSAMNTSNGTKQYSNGRYDSTGAMLALGPHYGSGAQPISMSNSNRGQPRRESIAGSLAGGMSWGGVSVGSWIRDE